jgi:hypothetical protein
MRRPQSVDVIGGVRIFADLVDRRLSDGGVPWRFA